MIIGRGPEFWVEWDATGRWERLCRFFVRTNAEAYISSVQSQHEGVYFRIITVPVR